MVIYSIGSLGSRAINFAVYPILTFFLIKSDLGYYDLIVNTIYLLIPLATFQISDGVYRAILPVNDRGARKAIISTGINIILTTTVVILLSVLIITKLFFPVQQGFLVFLMALGYALNISFKQIVRGLKLNKAYILSDIIYSFVFVCALLVFLNGYLVGLEGVFVSFILANVLSIGYLLIATEIISYMSFFKLPRRENIRALFRYSVPLIPNTLSWWLVGSANTYIITIILGLAANGIYAIAFKFSSIVYILNKIFTLAWQDQLIGAESEDHQYNSKILNRLLVFLLIMVGLITLSSKPLLRIIVTGEYYEAWKYIPLLLMATVFSSISSYFGAFYLSWQNTSKIFITTLYGALVAVISSVILTNWLGLMGTSIAMALGFGTVAITRYLDTRARLNLSFKPTILLILMAFIILSIAINYTI